MVAKAIRPAKRREAWIDNVKMVAMLFVVLGHTWRIIHCPLPEWLSLFILSFNMALFVIMTGYTSVNAIDKINNFEALYNYLYKITNRILLPSVVSSVALSIIIISERFIINGEMHIKRLLYLSMLILIIGIYIYVFCHRKTNNGKKVFLLLSFLSIPYALFFSSYWFFSMIWSVCCTMAVVSYLLKKSPWWGYIEMCITGFFLSIIVDSIYPKTSDFILFFLIGYALNKFDMLNGLYSSNKLFVCVVSSIFLMVGLSIISLIGEEPMNFWTNHFINMALNGNLFFYFMRIVASTLICLFFILVTKLVTNDYTHFSYWGAQTLALYIVHGAIIAICYQLPFVYEIHNTWSYLLYALLMTIIIIYISIEIIKRLMKSELTMAYCIGKIE